MASKHWWSFGFDPGINGCAWAMVRSDQKKVITGYLMNDYKVSPADPWDKTAAMIEVLEEFFFRFPHSANQSFTPLRWCVEAQFPGIGNPDHYTRLGWIAATAYGWGKDVRTERRIAVPCQWTKNVPKAKRQAEMLKDLPEKEKWTIIISDGRKNTKLTKRMWEDIIDAVGIAQWGLHG